MPVDKVWFSKSFFDGTKNNEYFVDFGCLDEKQSLALYTFMESLIEGKALPGRNKPSWLNKYGAEMPKAKPYKDHNIWHYHLGPHDENSACLTPNIRETNLGDHISDAVVHYTWRKDLNEIVILAVSPKHKPFPLPSERSNILRQRMRLNSFYPTDLIVEMLSQEE